MITAYTTPGLRRIARRPDPPDPPPRPGGARDAQERCDLCAEPLPPAHGHLLDVSADEVSCACRACALLFDREAAGGGHYRLLPDRRVRLDGLALDDLLWAALGVPVDLAFFVRSSTGGEAGEGGITARYPSPLGTLRSSVEPQTWAELERANPVLRELADDVEALLVDRTGGARRHWLLPLDDCYRLAAIVRTHWKGLGGGPDVHPHLDDFFDRLDGKEQQT
ncbi:DUF5947 family protein [Streptomyces sp. NPDC092296]|uniref:DUF5947 family protein n=1 Tax=Streptomyces sp. NPDC092296 TaxID=3366012 RepID=UPI003822EA32